MNNCVNLNQAQQNAREKFPRAVSNIHIKIKDNESRNQLVRNETANIDEQESNHKTVQNPWQPKTDILTLQGINESPIPSSPSSKGSSPMKSVSPITNLIAEGESLQLFALSPNSGGKTKKNEEMQTYTQGLYISLDNKSANLTTNYAGAINLSSKLNLELYKKQNQIKQTHTSVFQPEFQPTKLPSPMFSPTHSNTSSPRMSASGGQVVNMEGQVNRGVQGSQLKSMKKEQELKTVKQIDLEGEDQKTKFKKHLLNFPGVVQIQFSGQPSNFTAQLSGTTIPLMQKPLYVYRQKIKKVKEAQQKSNMDIQKFIEKRAEEEEKQTGRTSILQKQASQPFADEDNNGYDFQGRQTLQHFMSDWVDTAKTKKTTDAAKETQPLEEGEQGQHEQGSQIKLQTAESDNNYLTASQNEQRSPPPIVSGIKYTGSQLTFYDEKGVSNENKINHVNQQALQPKSNYSKPDIPGKSKRISKLQIQKLNILQQLELSEQAYMVRFPSKSLSPSPQQIKMKIRNAQIGLQQFTVQHSKQTQESMHKLMKLIQNEQLQGTLPLIQQPETVMLSPIPRINVGFNTFEHRNKSIQDQRARGKAAHHSNVLAVKQAQLNLDMIEPLKTKPANILIKHPYQSYQVAPQQAKPLLIQDSAQPSSANKPLSPNKTANNHNNQQLQTTYQSLPMTEIVSKQHTLYADSSMPSTKNLKKDMSVEEFMDAPRWADPQLDRVVMKQTTEGVITMRTYKVEEEQNFDVRLDTQGTLSAMNNTKEGFSKANKKNKVPEQMQITTLHLEDLQTTGKVKKQQNKHKLKKNSTSFKQNENLQMVKEMHKTLQDQGSNQSVLDQIMQLQESVYQQTIHNKKGAPGLQKGAIEICDRLDERSTLSPTELGFISGPAYSPVVLTNIEAKTTIDLRMKPLQQNPNRPSVQQTTTVFPLDLPSNFKKNEVTRKKIKIENSKTNEQTKQSPKNPFETHKSTFQDRKSIPETSKADDQSESNDFNLRSESNKDKFLNTTVGKTEKWKQNTRQGNFAHENGAMTPAPDQHVQDIYNYKVKRNSNPFVAHSNLLEVAQRFANKSTRNAPQSYHSEHTYQNAQNNSQYNSSYKYETATREFRKLKITDAAEKPTQLQIGGEGSPMLSLLPPLMTRDISPRYKSSIEKKQKAIKQMKETVNPDQTQSLLTKKNQLLHSSREDQNWQSNQLSKSQIKSPSGLTLIGAGAFEIARSGSVSQKSNDEGLQSRLSTSKKKKRQSNENLQKTNMKKNLSIEQISVLINNQSINEIGDRKAHDSSNMQVDRSKNINSASLLEIMQESYENLNRSRTDAQAELIWDLTKQFHKDVVVKQEFNAQNLAQAYHRRQLNVDGTWKAKVGTMGEKSFLEYLNPTNFQNPLDNFGLQTINPDRLLLMSNIDQVRTEVSPTQRRRSTKKHKDITMVGQRMNVNMQIRKQTLKNTEMKQYEHQTEYFEEIEDRSPQTQHPTQSSATNEKSPAPSKSKMDFGFTSPITLRVPIETKGTNKVVGQQSQMSMGSNSEGEVHLAVVPKLTINNSKEFLSTALLRYSPSSKLSKGTFGGVVKQPKTSRKQNKQVQSQSDVSQ